MIKTWTEIRYERTPEEFEDVVWGRYIVEDWRPWTEGRVRVRYRRATFKEETAWHNKNPVVATLPTYEEGKAAGLSPEAARKASITPEQIAFEEFREEPEVRVVDKIPVSNLPLLILGLLGGLILWLVLRVMNR